MGLDMFFSVPKRDDSFLYLRNHDAFLDLLCEQEPEQYMPGYTDFMITHDLLDRMEASMLADCEAEGLSVDRVPAALPCDFEDWDTEEMSWLELLPFYLCIVTGFRVWVREHRFIICSWSA